MPACSLQQRSLGMEPHHSILLSTHLLLAMAIMRARRGQSPQACATGRPGCTQLLLLHTDFGTRGEGEMKRVGRISICAAGLLCVQQACGASVRRQGRRAPLQAARPPCKRLHVVHCALTVQSEPVGPPRQLSANQQQQARTHRLLEERANKLRLRHGLHSLRTDHQAAAAGGAGPTLCRRGQESVIEHGLHGVCD